MPATRGDIKELTIIIGKSFNKIEEKFEKIDGRFDGVDARIEGIHRRFDAHDLVCVKRDEHDRLEKRVKVLEAA